MEIRQPVSVNRDYTYFFAVSQMFAFKLVQLPMGVEVLASIFWKTVFWSVFCHIGWTSMI